jgi:hypothetical protein
VYDLVVRSKVLLEFLLVEHLAVRDLSHQEFDDNQKLLSVNTEADCANLGSLSKGLNQGGLGLGVLKLHSLDATLVVQVPSVLIVGNTLREGGLNHEVASLLVKVLLEVDANDDVHGGRLADSVLVQAAVLVSLENKWADLGQEAELLIRNGDEIDRLGGEAVHRALVDSTDALKYEVTEFLGLRAKRQTGLDT